jgi:hypothetical protein
MNQKGDGNSSDPGTVQMDKADSVGEEAEGYSFATKYLLGLTKRSKEIG